MTDSGTAASSTAMSRTLKVIEALKARIHALEATPVADITGVSWRLPGDDGGRLDTGAQLWDFVAQGRNAIAPLPEDRHGPSAERWARIPNNGVYLPNVFAFDAGAFETGGDEAVGMDPRHRLLLMVCSEALERAGVPPRSQEAGRVGLFLAGMEDDYREWADDPATYAWASGNGGGVALGRLAYSLGINGPAILVDAACASSLAAIEAARLALQRQEVDAALVAAVDLVMSPRAHEEHIIAGSISPTGSNRSYSADADGFVRGDACIAVVLQRPDDAGERTIARIAGAAVNQNGRSTGLGAPNVLTQEAVVRRALEDASIGPDDVAFIEGHGTATPIGDAIEVEAYNRVFSKSSGPVPLTCGKSNFGHAESAAGMVGLLRAMVSLRRECVAPIAGFTSPNTLLDPAQLRVAFAAQPLQLAHQDPLRALVTSFGAVGTNAAVVLESGSAMETLDDNPVGNWTLDTYRPSSVG